MMSLSRNLFHLLLIVGIVACNSEKPPLKDPNIIVIVADDLGWSDLSSYGNNFIETPHLDKLASQGVRFSNGYAPASLCSPSRASIVTGLHPVRVNITEHIHGNQKAGPNQKLQTPPISQALDTAFLTTAEAVKGQGYTTAYFGKWHLGGGKSKPANQGFDYTYAASYHGLPNSFYYPFFNHGMEDIKADTEEGDFLSDVLTKRFIGHIREIDGKFLAYLNFYAPHVPIEGRKDLTQKYVSKAGGQNDGPIPNPHYAAMVEGIDRNVGRLLDSLRHFGLMDNTVIIFTSDNGGLSVREVPAFAKHTPPTDNYPLNAGKGYLYEGGVRVPFIIYGQNRFSEKQVINTPVSGTDIHNTILDLTGINQFTEDGQSLLSVVENQQREKPIFFHVPHYSPQRGLPASSVRKGDYKLIYFYEDARVELFNVANDPEELKDLSGELPEIKEELLSNLRNWKRELGAKDPVPNPEYNGE
ncbi:MAG: sulfatase [Cyclobacteriaceae bacterium]